MEEELKLDQAVPTLTFEPFTETKKEAPKPRFWQLSRFLPYVRGGAGCPLGRAAAGAWCCRTPAAG